MKKGFRIPSYFYFIFVSILIILAFPREGKFRYLFAEGKPWKYGLLTAPFNFPIYKTAPEMKNEQDSIVAQIAPYFQMDSLVINKQLGQFAKDRKASIPATYSPSSEEYIERSLKEIYRVGIVSVNDYHFLIENRYNYFMIFEENIAVQHSTNDIFTSKSAYSYLLDNCPSSLSVEQLKTINLDLYLMENLKYDNEMSDKVRNELLQQLSPSKGMVQAGEKIIDRGEIINEKTFNILASLRLVFQSRTGSVQRQGGLFLGVFILVASLMVCYLMYLYYFKKSIYDERKHVVFVLSLATTFILLTEICVQFSLFNVYIIPYAIIPIAIRIFFDSRTAQMTHHSTILICSLMVPFPFEFILLQLITCMVALYALKDLTQRSQLIQCSFCVLLGYLLIYVGLVFFQEGDLMNVNWKMFLFFGINFIFLMFTYAFIYIIEKIFGYTSNVTLIELSDINSPVLREMSETCPGTFQHSLQVSMLGAAAAGKIGANAQLVRTGALYHDIGKMTNPVFFIENQVGNVNPHERLDFVQSAKIIINHIAEGIRIAEKNKLPSILIDFIRTHHGKGKAKYFYNSFKNAFPDQPIDEAAFTYLGPNPSSRETAILMMADAVEASSRSLNDYSEKSIAALVERIINIQIQEGLLKNAPITLRDIEDVKIVFIEKLMITYHSRITYPELKV